MSNVESVIRAVAVVAAVVVVAGPALVAAARFAISKVAGWKQAEPVTGDDAHVILEIARRLQKSGNAQGVKLCQQLLDVMLQPEKAK